MFYKKIIVLFLFLPLVAFAKPTTTTELKIVRTLTPKESISLYAREYGASEKELLVVAKCESQLNPKAIHSNDGGEGKHSVGIFQYQKTTFDRFENLIGENLDYYSYNDQAKLTAYIFTHYPEYKTQWTCWRINYQ